MSYLFYPESLLSSSLTSRYGVCVEAVFSCISEYEFGLLVRIRAYMRTDTSTAKPPGDLCVSKSGKFFITKLDM